jgi:hypothetical protein
VSRPSGIPVQLAGADRARRWFSTLSGWVHGKNHTAARLSGFAPESGWTVELTDMLTKTRAGAGAEAQSC